MRTIQACLLVAVTTAASAAPIHVGPVLESPSVNEATGQASVWVLWEMERGVSAPNVELGLSAVALTQARGGVSRDTEKPGPLLTEMHEVELSGLLPDTLYYYRVQTDVAAFSATYRFRTPPLPSARDSFRFVATSDEQPGADNTLADPAIHRRVIDELIRDHCGVAEDCPDEIALVLSAGDNVGTGGNYDEYAWWFGVRAELQRHVPQVVAPGNHDYYSDADLSHWRGYHRNPRNGRMSVAFPALPDHPDFRPDHEERWYFVDRGNVRFVSMDSNGYDSGAEDTSEMQDQWLDAVLADACSDPDLDFVVAQFHHNHSDEYWLQHDAASIGNVVRRLEQFSSDCGKPSAHLYGHTHEYNRGQSRDHHHSIVNTSSAGGTLATAWEPLAQDLPEVQTTDVSYGWVSAEVTAGATPSITFRRHSTGDSPSAPSGGIVDTFTITRTTRRPDAPAVVSATLPGPGDPPRVALRATPYADPDGVPHQASHWQVTATAGDYSAPAAESWEKFENWLNGVDTQAGNDLTSGELGNLDGMTTYHWRVRYRNQNFHWSDWSAEGSFTTVEPLRPTLVLDRAEYAVGETIRATFAKGPGNPTDWIGIYSNPGNGPVGCSSVGPSTVWLYTNGTTTSGGSLTDGSVDFGSGTPDVASDGDWPLPPGDYLAYFLEADGYCELAAPVGFRIVPHPVAVPDGGATPGIPLTVEKAGVGDLFLDWDVACLATDYCVYSGTLASLWWSRLYDHVPLRCSTSGLTEITLPAPADEAYLLVVPRDAAVEGSYGVDSTGAARPAVAAACLPRVIGVCP